MGVALESEKDPFVLVAVDNCGVPAPVVEAVAKHLRDKAAIKRRKSVNNLSVLFRCFFGTGMACISSIVFSIVFSKLSSITPISLPGNMSNRILQLIGCTIQKRD